ncbi:hypothetical protein [Microbacterium sp. HJ5]
MKRSTRLYWVAGIAGAIVGTSALAGASPGSDNSADSYDLALLSDANTVSPASALPDDFDFANLEDEIDPGTLRLVGTSGHAVIFTAFSASGELCVISSIDVSVDDWAVGSACQSADSFNARGAALRMTTPTESVEAYLLPDSAVVALRAAGNNLTSADAPNVVFTDAYDTGDERARLSKTLQEVGVMVYPEGESDGY